MGFKFLISSTVSNDSNLESKPKDEVHETYFIKTKTFKATMTETDQGYIVAKGSEAKKDLSPSCTDTYRNMRRKLIETKIMVENGDILIFEEDAVFTSPSAASNMVLGRNSNGFTEWVTKKGETFKKVQEKINN
jgi:predicted type IV restriction endonuclease